MRNNQKSTSPKRYADLNEKILKKLTKPMSTNEIQIKLVDVNWKTIYNRLEKMWKEGKIKKIKTSNSVIWEKSVY